MRGGRAFYSLVWTVGVLWSLEARADANPPSLSLLPASWSVRRFPSIPVSMPALSEPTLPSTIARAIAVAHAVIGHDSNGLRGTLTDPLALRSSPFASGRRTMGRIAWANFGGPVFHWAMPPRTVCERTSACPVSQPTLEMVNRTYGLVWAGGGGPVAQLLRGRMSLGPLGSASVAIEGSFFGTMVGYQATAVSLRPTTTVGTNVGVGLALELERVAIHLQFQTVLYLVEPEARQPIAGQHFATFAIEWAKD